MPKKESLDFQASPWRKHLASVTESATGDEGGPRACEMFYAHLSLAPMNSSPERFIEKLISQLPLRKKTKDYLRAQDPQPYLLYRHLVRDNFRNTLEAAIPRTMARMGELFEKLFDDFLSQVATESHILRDVVQDFLQFVRTTPSPEFAPYLLELAELEAVRITVASQVLSIDREEEALSPDLDRRLVFSDALRLLSFSHAVHLLPEALDDRSLPASRQTHLLSYRDDSNEVLYMELSESAAFLVDRLQKGDTLGAAIQGTRRELGCDLNDEFLAGCAKILSDLSRRGAITKSIET